MDLPHRQFFDFNAWFHPQAAFEIAINSVNALFLADPDRERKSFADTDCMVDIFLTKGMLNGAGIHAMLNWSNTNEGKWPIYRKRFQRVPQNISSFWWRYPSTIITHHCDVSSIAVLFERVGYFPHALKIILICRTSGK